MDHAAEQEMESEALSSIFASDFVAHSPTHWSLKIVPILGGSTSENHVGVTLDATLPPTYPECLPSVVVVLDRGLSPDHLPALDGLVKDSCEANLGMAMMYCAVESVREWLLEHNVKGQEDTSMYAQMMRKAQEAAKEKVKVQLQYESHLKSDSISATEALESAVSRRRKEGTPCTPENFAAWRKAWDEGKALAKAAKEGAKEGDEALDAGGNKRRTGFEIFSAKGGLEEDDIEKMAGLMIGEAAAESGVDPSVFLEGGDEDLDDLDFGEEEDDEDDEEWQEGDEDDDDDDDEDYDDDDDEGDAGI